jgi:hypothetical protein
MARESMHGGNMASGKAKNMGSSSPDPKESSTNASQSMAVKRAKLAVATEARNMINISHDEDQVSASGASAFTNQNMKTMV